MKEKSRLLEADIKALTLTYLRDKNIIDENSIIMNELTVGNFSRRVDLAVCSQGKLLAFEIKSEADSLCRLAGQLDKYLEYFDKVVVVSDTKFISSLTESLPTKIGLWEVANAKIKVKQKGQLQRKIDNSKLIDMMDLSDLRKLSSRLNLKMGKDKESIETSLELLSNKVLRQEVKATLSRKYLEVTKSFMDLTRSRKVESEDIKILSRYGKYREKIKIEQSKSKAFWDNIEQHAADFKSFAEASAFSN
ncbi:sce7726 family protein [Vibrio parahaemolyticus]|uniref:sce7726 family protein n=1 Tax=Vibrio parahaemolyticus TaxID=670 RepID=UPI0023625A71|nr:sce7726 family protein [Vibrio parahaemolyticus]EIA1588306.1 sce7726 family protein [Vibrio parahaemolyticus]EJG0778539.1 sce7726 family protein [Vibrio parahaemolyticus]MBE5149429.1 sce7726 family protein [Vibrio parahaemolyticus]MDF4719803.1 sce7726 family protein [Vibrio parahaemolyticus]